MLNLRMGQKSDRGIGWKGQRQETVDLAKKPAISLPKINTLFKFVDMACEPSMTQRITSKIISRRL